MKQTRKLLIVCLSLAGTLAVHADEFCAFDTRAPREGEENGQALVVGPCGICAAQVFSSINQIETGGEGTGNVSATDAFTTNNRLVTVDLPGGARFVKESAAAVLDGANNLSGINRVTVAAGTVAVPSIQFAGSTNTGVAAATANELSLSTNGVEHLLIDAGGNTTYSNNYKMHAYRSTNQPSGVGITILFDTETFDPSNSYDPTTGIFTVPFTGTYRSCAVVTAQGNVDSTAIGSLVLNGNPVTGSPFAQRTPGGAPTVTASSVVLVALSEGDELRVDYIPTLGAPLVIGGSTYWSIAFVSN